MRAADIAIHSQLGPALAVILAIVTAGVAAYLIELLTRAVSAFVPYPRAPRARAMGQPSAPTRFPTIRRYRYSAARWTLRTASKPFWRALPLLTYAALLTLALGLFFGWESLQPEETAFNLLVIMMAVLALFRAYRYCSCSDLALEVQNAEGKNDPAGKTYLATRLYRMGTAEPKGIRLPRQTDVTALADIAAAALLGATFLGPLVRFLALHAGSCPWRATVTILNDHQVDIHIEYHRRTVARLFGDSQSRYLPDRAIDGMPDLGRNGLLTIAAAAILQTMASRHAQLQEGLGGATDWRSLACQVVAITDLEVQHAEIRENLLARAVNIDPGNLTSRMAWIRLRSDRTTTSTEQRHLAEDMTSLYWEIAQHSSAGPGRALYLRALYNAAAVWFRTARLERAEGPASSRDTRSPDALGYSSRYLSQLVEALCETRNNEGLSLMVRQLKPQTGWLWLLLRAVGPDPVATPDRDRSVRVVVNPAGIITRQDQTTGNNLGAPLVGGPPPIATGSTVPEVRMLSLKGMLVLEVHGPQDRIQRWDAVTGDKLDSLTDVSGAILVSEAVAEDSSTPTNGQTAGRSAVIPFKVTQAELWVMGDPNWTAKRRYDHACFHSTRGEHDEALQTLEKAVVDPEYRIHALYDASFAEFRDPAGVSTPGHPTDKQLERFYDLIGQPAPALLRPARNGVRRRPSRTAASPNEQPLATIDIDHWKARERYAVHHPNSHLHWLSGQPGHWFRGQHRT